MGAVVERAAPSRRPLTTSDQEQGMHAMAYNSETRQLAHLASGRSLDRRALLEGVTASALGMGLTLGATAPAAASAFDPKAEAKRIAFDRTGRGDEVLLISGFPQTRRSWNRMMPLLSKDFRTIAADLPSFGAPEFFPRRRRRKTSAGFSTNLSSVSVRPCMSLPTISAPGWPTVGHCCSRRISGR